MKRRHTLSAALGLCGALGNSLSAAQTPAPPVGEVKPLGQDRYQIGRIVVDKRARRFTVPGRVNVFDKPLEYLAGSPGGRKGYETLLELDASGTEFNLACILIGLERDPGLQPWQAPSRTAPVGPRVILWVAWNEGDQRRRMPAAEALFNAQAGANVERVEWIYTGSFTSRDGSQFAADHVGSLIGFVHDPTTVIEAAAAIGRGAYGSVRGNPALPPVASAVDLIVEAANAGK